MMNDKRSPLDKVRSAAEIIAEDADRKQNSRTDNPIATSDKEDEKDIEKLDKEE